MFLMLAQARFAGGDFGFQPVEPGLGFAQSFAVELELALRVFQPAAAIAGAGAGGVEASFLFGESGAVRGERGFLRGERVLGVGLDEPQPLDLGAGVAQVGIERGPLGVAEVRFQQRQIAVERLVATGLCRLALEAAELAADFGEDVAEALEIGIGGFELAQRVAALGLVFCDARRFFENRAPVLGAGRQNRVNLALLHDGVGAPADAGVHERSWMSRRRQTVLFNDTRCRRRDTPGG